MEAAPPGNAASGLTRAARFHRRRARRDRWVRRSIGLGGLLVIAAIALIFFYLLYTVAPLFRPATVIVAEAGHLSGSADGAPLLLALEEQGEVGLRVSSTGEARFFRIADGATIRVHTLAEAAIGGLQTARTAIEQNGLVAAATAAGDILLFRHEYETRFEGGVSNRTIVPRLEYPYGEAPLLQIGDTPIRALALSESEQGLALAALDASGTVTVILGERVENLLTGERRLEAQTSSVPGFTDAVDIALSGDHRWLYVGSGSGKLQRVPLPALAPVEEVSWRGGRITTLAMLLGGVSLLVGDDEGRITQLFPVRGESGPRILEPVRQFAPRPAAVERIEVESRRKGFAVLDRAGGLALYHATSGRLLLERSLADAGPWALAPGMSALAIAPRADRMLVEGGAGRFFVVGVHNDHPEVSFASLWREVWYENYDEPAYVWQSSAATREFEPKFSLTPLVFGTVKAALYAMLFAVPLALMGAAYTACFMAPALRRVVKPGIEIMAALPTVILGFLAGLWLAPFVEEHLAGLFLLVLFTPLGLLLSGFAWHRVGARWRAIVPEGYEPLLLIPVLIACAVLAFAAAESLQTVLLGEDLRSWLNQVAGIDYDQRNALVVGCAMGFAIIPTIFTIAEDAMASIPASLSNGSLALGATPWQTLVHVVMPTASPGIFSALMIGFGRAVGETMIVLMATGNTPIMDWNLFEGMRTLAANIAIELPESEVGSTHYRILFLAALVLFLFTFAVNTAADVVRHRLRRRYGSL